MDCGCSRPGRIGVRVPGNGMKRETPQVSHSGVALNDIMRDVFRYVNTLHRPAFTKARNPSCTRCSGAASSMTQARVIAHITPALQWRRTC